MLCKGSATYRQRGQPVKDQGFETVRRIVEESCDDFVVEFQPVKRAQGVRCADETGDCFRVQITTLNCVWIRTADFGILALAFESQYHKSRLFDYLHVSF